MTNENKLNAKQKLALERINRLFELTLEMNKSKRDDKEKYTKRYLSLAKKLGEKVNVSIPKEIQKQYCKKCNSLNVKNSTKEPFFIVKCNDCNFEKKYSTQN